METLRTVRDKLVDCGHGIAALPENHAILTQKQAFALLEQAQPEEEIADPAPFLGLPLRPDEVVLSCEDV